MRDAEPSRPSSNPSSTSAPGTGAQRDSLAPPAKRSHKPQIWLAVGLTGLLGVVWAVAIASRYPGVLPG
ncbi:hypothetical protein [Methylobacterium sp. Leaf117]|uniref:hypothetical protein n=1 Tax=Methylobacterium sp. Leaf117 TaxID=1736260 RepID=UPI0006F26E3C|nr:hypothetical protein [Methylobacterium sp. Leaf117]KQP91752.1 hypothetical protein ASF57_04315 [Methylobacterium sp. Leaf117]